MSTMNTEYYTHSVCLVLFSALIVFCLFVCCCWLSERVGSMKTRMHYVFASLVQDAVCTCCALRRKVWKRVCVKWLAREKKTYLEGQQQRHGSANMKRFAGLSLVPTSQFIEQVSPVPFVFPSSAFSVLWLSPLRTALFTTTHIAWHSVAAWARVHISITWMGWTWSVGRSNHMFP